MPRAGKDTIAAALEAQGYYHAKFADALYYEVAKHFNVTKEQLHSHEWKTEPRPELAGFLCSSAKYRGLLQSLGHDLAKPQTSRTHLQLWATEFRRASNPFYWITEIDFNIIYVRGPIVISDLRFQDEYEHLAKFCWRTNRHFRLIEVTRDGVIHTGHVSDDPMPSAFIDFTVRNVEGDPSSAVDTVLHYLGINRYHYGDKNDSPVKT